MALQIYYPEITNNRAEGTVLTGEFEDLYSAVNAVSVYDDLLDLCETIGCGTVRFEATETNGISACTEHTYTLIIQIGRDVFESTNMYESLAEAVPQFTQYANTYSESYAEQSNNAPVP